MTVILNNFENYKLDTIRKKWVHPQHALSKYARQMEISIYVGIQFEVVIGSHSVCKNYRFYGKLPDYVAFLFTCH